MGAGCLHILNRWSCVANEDCPCKREQYQKNMRATLSQSICVQCGTKLDIGLGFDSASHSAKENAPALTPTHEGTCAVPNPSSSANQVASQSIQEDVYHV